MVDQSRPHLRVSASKQQGFILLEVLVAISLILGAWIASVEVYQRLALNLSQLASKRSQLKKEMDAFEVQEQVRSNVQAPEKRINHDSARVPNRHRPLYTSTQSAYQN